jgi:proline dehydrogenase
MKALTFLARRFVAGEAPQDAVRAGERLHEKGIRATFDKLGEDVHDVEAAERAASAAKAVLRFIPTGIERNVSIKMSSMGQEISRDLCLEKTASILDVAKEVDGFVRLDMEGSKLTQDTIEIFHALRKDYDNVGIVLQAYLHRTLDDIRESVRRGDRVRLCKGAYREPPETAAQDMPEIRRRFQEGAHLLLEEGTYPAIATHDEEIVQDTVDHVRQRGIDSSRFEFQMLFGLRPKRWSSLVADGFNMRVYVPYGTHWMPYFYRRLRERKENVLFVLKNLFGG